MRLSPVLVFALLAGAASSGAQAPVEKPPGAAPQAAPGKPPDQSIGITVSIVNVPFTVLDQKDRLVVDLKKDDFEVFENGKRVPIRFFTPLTKVPLRIGLLLDTSNSVRLYFKAEQQAAIDFIHSMTESNPHNRLFLMTFDFGHDLLQDFTNDADTLSTLVRKLKPGGGTALYDAIYYACQQKLRHESQEGGLRRVLVALTDGEDDASEHSMEQAIDAAKRADVTIYPIATISWGYHSPGEKVLDRLAEETGGRVVYPWKKPPSAEYATGYLSHTQLDGQNAVYEAGSGKYSSEEAGKLADALGLIQRELESQYSLAYVPPNPVPDGKYREIRLKTVYDGLRIRSRRGYYPLAEARPAAGKPAPAANPTPQK